MTAPAAIIGSLVDAKNVGVHKCLRLTIDIPVERALHVIECFGWPTQANPVPVAIAKLDPKAVSANGKQAVFETVIDGPIASTAAKKSWHELAPSQQTGILCNEPSFAVFLEEHYADNYAEASCIPTIPERAAECVRLVCGVSSRAEITPESQAGKMWKTMAGDYRDWMRNAEL